MGTLSQMEYLAIGFAGAPVFAGGKFGLIALLGPTGGYLIGFIAAAYLAGLVAESAARPGRVRFFIAGPVGTNQTHPNPPATYSLVFSFCGLSNSLEVSPNSMSCPR